MLKKSWLVLVLFGALAWFPLVAHAEPARWNLDLDHSTVEFRVAHMIVSKTTGRFTDYAGFVDMDAEAGTVKAIEVTIKAGSVNTNHEKRDAHIRNVDFLDVEHYPTIIFKMKSYKKAAEGFIAVGDLTLHGVAKEVTLAGQYNGATNGWDSELGWGGIGSCRVPCRIFYFRWCLRRGFGGRLLRGS